MSFVADYLKDSTSQTSVSECSPRGSRLPRTVPSNRVGSWGIMLNLDLKSCRPMVEMSSPSITILPPTGSTMRNRACISVDFPLPVRPTTPIFLPPQNVHVTPCSTIGKWSLYRTFKHSNNKFWRPRRIVRNSTMMWKQQAEICVRFGVDKANTRNMMEMEPVIGAN